MSVLWRRTSFALALAAGLGCSQAPEYVQQYRQRLGGAIDELDKVVAGFDADSARAGMSHDQGVDRLSRDDDAFLRDRADRLREETGRLAKLRRQADALNSPAPLGRLYGFVADFDPDIARRAYGDFTPAAPLTPDGLLSTAIGFLASLALLRLAGLPFRRRAKRGTPAGVEI